MMAKKWKNIPRKKTSNRDAYVGIFSVSIILILVFYFT